MQVFTAGHGCVAQQAPDFGSALLAEFTSATELARVAYSQLEPDERHQGISAAEVMTTVQANLVAIGIGMASVQSGKPRSLPAAQGE